MKTHKSFAYALTLTIALMLLPTHGEARSNLSIAAAAYAVADHATGEILTEKDINKTVSPSGFAKIMTVYLTAKAIKEGELSLTEQVTISQAASAKSFPDAPKMFLPEGEKVSIDSLLKGAAIQRGNDATVALAEAVSGSEIEFVKLMNATARELDMTQTTFVNCTGSDAEGQTTANDLLKLSSALIRDFPEIYEIFASKQFTYNGITQYNRNALLWDKSMTVDGLSTSHSSSAGYNIIASSVEGDSRVIAVVLGASSANDTKAEGKKLLKYGYLELDAKN